MENLKALSTGRPKGPVVLVIMDGVGVARHPEGDAVGAAWRPNFLRLRDLSLATTLRAHGTAVGLPADDDMGNSEVGHNAIGCGRVFAQGAKLVNEAINSGAMFKDRAWRDLLDGCRERGTLHFIGLFSDGNVHSHLDHLRAMLKQARVEGIKRARIHVLLDGRDVPETSALDYVDAFEDFLAQLNADGATDYRIASGGGRMVITMDRYNANWDMVRKGWETHVQGKGCFFPSARAAIEAFRKERPGVIDQDLPPFVIAQNDQPVGPIKDGDSVILFNFRGDRAIEITRAFEEPDLTQFNRGALPRVLYAGMMQYDGDLKLPKRFLVNPPAIDRTMGAYLAKAGVRQLAISETQKFGHVTYFFNGNRSGKFNDKLEDYIEIPSDIVPFEERPWMKSAEITDYVVDAVLKNEHPFIRLNYPNGDMVGHTGVYAATLVGVECVDLGIGRLASAVEAVGGVMVISADHGNADDMFERDKKGKVQIDERTGRPKAKTSHSLNPVPCLVYDPAKTFEMTLSVRPDLGISSLAATCLNLLGYEAPADYDPSVVNLEG